MRTIILASWDAEEYGLMGSTEFAEDHGDWLANRSEYGPTSLAGRQQRGYGARGLELLDLSVSTSFETTYGNGGCLLEWTVS